MIKSLRYITLNTGHGSMSPRADIPDSAIDKLVGTIDAGGGKLWATDWTLWIIDRRPGLAGWQIGHAYESPWIVSLTCWDESASDTAWAIVPTIAEAAGLTRDSAWRTPHRPPAPWLVTAIMPAISEVAVKDIIALGDAGRCIAWAMIEAAG